MKELTEIIRKDKPKCIISVGDVVSQNMLKQGIQTQIVIIDNKVMRENTQPLETAITRKISVKNPAGTLTPETWLVIEQALRQKQPTQIIVEGEEDLLTLVAVLKAPEDSLVVYGQPREGIVVVKVDKSAKERVRRIVEAMAPSPKS